MKKITYASIREEFSTRIAPNGTAWIGQIGEDYSYDQTTTHNTPVAAALDIARVYNDNIDEFAGQEVRIVLMTIVDGCADDCIDEIIVREAE